ncbi:MAG: type II secretion system protein GspG [Armatimonadetes bacterium]|nr:type II secretion system protein GspG [Armatimonadota bacterium]
MYAAPHRSQGMTLVRFLLILAVVGCVVFSVAESAGRRNALKKRQITIDRILVVRDALEKFAIDNAGFFPPTNVGLSVLVEKPAKPDRRIVRWNGPYLPSRQYLYDGWGRPFHYCRGGRGDPPHPYELWSYGPDNRDDGPSLFDDVDVWKPDSLVAFCPSAALARPDAKRH